MKLFTRHIRRHGAPAPGTKDDKGKERKWKFQKRRERKADKAAFGREYTRALNNLFAMTKNAVKEARDRARASLIQERILVPISSPHAARGRRSKYNP